MRSALFRFDLGDFLNSFLGTVFRLENLRVAAGQEINHPQRG